MRRLAFAILAVGLVAGCSSSGGGGSSPHSSGGAGGDSVVVKNFSFNPANLTVSKGTKVTWTFDDAAQHNVTASNNAFKSPDLNDGKTFSYTFNSAGKYNYICTIHQYMKGSVTVKP